MTTVQMIRIGFRVRDVMSSFCIVVLLVTIGCGQGVTNRSPSAVPAPAMKTIRELEGWQATYFFSDETALRICEAITSHDGAQLNCEIEGKVDLNIQGEGGFTLLYWALVENNRSAFEALLKHGADPDQVLSRTILGKRVNFNKNESVIFSSMRCFRGHFSVDALPYSKNVKQQRAGKDNLLHVFFQTFDSSSDILQALIAAGIDVNAVGSYGYTPCHYAAIHNPELCRPLIEAGADPDIRNDDGHDILETLQRQRARLAQVKQGVAVYDEVIAWLKGRTAVDSAQPQ